LWLYVSGSKWCGSSKAVRPASYKTNSVATVPHWTLLALYLHLIYRLLSNWYTICGFVTTDRTVCALTSLQPT